MKKLNMQKMRKDDPPIPIESLLGRTLVGINLHKEYDGRVLLTKEGITIGPRARIGLVGENGSGKSTLLRIISGQESPDAGEVFGQGVKIGYLPQDLSPDRTKTIQEVVGLQSPTSTPVSSLSGGEILG